MNEEGDLGGPQENLLEESADLMEVRKELRKDEHASLIGVGKVFDKLKKDLGLGVEDKNKQLVV